MKCPTPQSLLSPRTYPCGRQLFPLSEKPCAAREQTRRWDPLFTESSRRLDYLPQTCVWRCCLVMIRTSRDGATMSFAVFGHRSSSAISRSRRWATSTRFRKGSKPRWQRREGLLHMWRSLGLGATSQRTTLRYWIAENKARSFFEDFSTETGAVS